ncbi:MAG: hypothetical protein ACR2JB_23840 [Bryobacteraceae bacterium]
MNGPVVLRSFASFGTGIAISTGYPVGIAAAIGMPTLAMHQPTRRTAYRSAFCYYAGALWPVIPAARNFFGASASLLDGVVAWFVAAILLAAPWPIAWTTRRGQFLWRVPLALFATVVPPIGLIGWASPLTATGFIFPGTAWIGLLIFAVLCGWMSSALAARTLVAALALLATSAHLNFAGDPTPPTGWEGVNTCFGAIAHGATAPVSEYAAAQWIQDRARSSRAQVIVFPEMVVPRWTEATDLFWQPTLATLSASGKMIALGAGLPDLSATVDNPSARLQSYDFSAAVATLRSDAIPNPLSVGGLDPSDRQDGDRYRNAIMIRGAQRGTFIQRIPVPLGMWHPFSVGGVPLNLAGHGVIRLRDQRAAILICHEQLLTWPVLASMLENPTILVAVANDYWVEQTSIPRYQANAVRAWAGLFSLPIVSAVNK